MKAIHACLNSVRRWSCILTIGLSVAISGQVWATNNPPSFEPGIEPYSSACDGAVRIAGWMQNVTDNDGDNSTLRFEVTSVSNPEIFTVHPWVSWPSLSLNYQIKPGIPGGLASAVTAVLKDDGGGADTSQPQTWRIYTVDCVDDPLTGAEQAADTDRDGIPDNIDTDDDNDGISDVEEGAGVLDTDGDGTADSVDLDSDNDQIPDQDEAQDSDGDGIRDSEEPNGRDVKTDTDGDGVNDDRDLDDDNDGIIDSLEGAGFTDTDNDGIVDSRDLDSDNDGRSDLLESGLDLIVLTFDESWSLEDEVGANGLVDLVETFADSGYPLNYPVDVDADGIPDFQDVTSRLLSNDDSGSVSATQSVSTGLEGAGCSVGAGRFDPVLLITLLFSMLGLTRRSRRYKPVSL